MDAKEEFVQAEFEKVEKLGFGAFGVVWKCVNKQAGVEFALKEVTLEAQYLKSIYTEILILREVAIHNRLVKFYGSRLDTERRVIMIFMEYMNKGSLKDVMNKSGVFTEIQAAKYTKAVLEGLDFLHEHNVIHRDVKCGNILLDDRDNVKLTGFGLSKCVEDKSVVDNHTFCGTVNFMAPEIIERNAYSSSVDIWALGVTVVEMLTGKPIFPDMPPILFVLRIMTFNINDLHLQNVLTLSKDLKYFLKLTFIKQPNGRPKARDLFQCQFILNADQ